MFEEEQLISRKIRIDNSKLNKFGELKKSKASIDGSIDKMLIDAMGHRNEFELVKKLLSLGANPNSNSAQALTLCREVQTTELLLEHGANLHAMHDRAFWVALRRELYSKMKVLFLAGAYVSESKVSRTYFDGQLYSTLRSFFDTYLEPHNLLRYMNVREKHFKKFYEDDEFLSWANDSHTASLDNNALYLKFDEFAKKYDIDQLELLNQSAKTKELYNLSVQEDTSRILNL